LLHAIGECKLTLTDDDVKQFLDKAAVIAKHVYENPILVPGSTQDKKCYKLYLVIVANFRSSSIDKQRVVKIASDELNIKLKGLRIKYEVKPLDIEELQNELKKVEKALPIYSLL